MRVCQKPVGGTLRQKPEEIAAVCRFPPVSSEGWCKLRASSERWNTSSGGQSTRKKPRVQTPIQTLRGPLRVSPKAMAHKNHSINFHHVCKRMAGRAVPDQPLNRGTPQTTSFRRPREGPPRCRGGRRLKERGHALRIPGREDLFPDHWGFKQRLTDLPTSPLARREENTPFCQHSFYFCFQLVSQTLLGEAGPGACDRTSREQQSLIG